MPETEGGNKDVFVLAQRTSIVCDDQLEAKTLGSNPKQECRLLAFSHLADNGSQRNTTKLGTVCYVSEHSLTLPYRWL